MNDRQHDGNIAGMINDAEKKRLGLVHVDGLTWMKNSEMLKEAVGRQHIVKITESEDDGELPHGWDIVVTHPDLDEINDGDPLPLYSFSFVTGKFEKKV